MLPSPVCCWWTLDNTLVDETWNYNLTQGSWTFVQLSSWRYVLSLDATVSANWAYYNWWPDLRNKDLTWNVWCRDTAGRSGYNWWSYINLKGSSNIIISITHAWPSQSNKIYAAFGTLNNFSVAPTYNDTYWHNIVFTYKYSDKTLKQYVDNVLKATSTVGDLPSATTETYLWYYTTWYGNDVHLQVWASIIESKERTTQEISDYYDQTKWDYWIS